MKKLALVVLVGMTSILMASSCKSKSKIAQAEPAVVAAPVSQETPGKKPVAPKPAAPDSLVLSFERTPCFGTCPVFAVNIYKSGYATYEGKSNAPRTGMFFAYLDKATIKDIAERANTSGFFTINDEYDGNVSDLPWRKTFVRYKGTSKKVINKGGGEIPDVLVEMENLMENTIKEMNWQPMPVRTK